MTPFHLHNKTILVTGASSGIGRQVGISISEMGGKVIATGRNKERLEETIALLSGSYHSCFSVDLLNETERSSFVNQLRQLDGVVHCAGVVNPYPITFLTQEKINETFDINYQVPVLLMAALSKSKKLNKRASVVFLSSISGQHPHKGGAMYAGSKAALEAFSKVTALEFYAQGIRSNCISPAMVKTDMYDRAEEGMSKQAMDKHVEQYPLGVGLPEDVANAVIYLLSDASKWVTGINLTLDGGFLLEAK